MPTIGRHIITVVAVCFLLGIGGCNASSTDNMSSWNDQKAYIQQQVNSVSKQAIPISITAAIVAGEWELTFVTYAAPPDTTIRFTYDPQALDTQLRVEQNNDGASYWEQLSAEERAERLIAFDAITIGPSEAYRIAVDYATQKGQGWVAQEHAGVALYLDKPWEDVSQSPTWAVLFTTPQESVQVIVDATNKNVVKASL